MSNKDNERKDAFRRMDKPAQGGRMDEALGEELKEKGDAHSDTTRQKGEEAREIIDSQRYERRKGKKLNSPQ